MKLLLVPDEILIKILQYVDIDNVKELYRIKRVNNRFYRLCRDFTILENLIRKKICERCCDKRVISDEIDEYSDLKLNELFTCESCTLDYDIADINGCICSAEYCDDCKKNANLCGICCNPDRFCKDCLITCERCGYRVCCVCSSFNHNCSQI